MQIRTLKSPNVNDRAGGVTPSYIILHYTGTKTASEAEEIYMTPDQVSPHYMIDYDGTITSYVPEDKRAWHAGKSYWRGIEDMNSHSIGIEIVNPGHELFYRDFTQAQMDALQTLCPAIMARHNIKPANIIGHSDIAPGRKIDPGELLDWRTLARSNIGVWPHPCGEDFDWVDGGGDFEPRLCALLHEIGYNPDLPPAIIIEAFQRHFHPKIFQMEPSARGVADRESLAIAHSCALLMR